jgi:sorting nexin-8
MTAPKKSSSRSRSPPCPNSILDRKALCQALEDRNIHVKPSQIETFYQCLHRQHYPELPVFVENYYKYENDKRFQSADDELELSAPLKNFVSKKSRNKKELNKQLLDFLKDPNSGFTTVTSTIDCTKQSSDQVTTKLAIQLHDGHKVESVLMRYNSVAGSRVSLCVSSQVGCAMLCSFCATATMGFLGNLTAGEILEQMVHANRILAKEWKENKDPKEYVVRNVVFMGMGEPLNNYDNVVEACRCMMDRKRWSLAHDKITVSTVGVTPRIRDLTRDLPEVSLALSLHAPNQDARSTIVPAAKAYKIEDLIEALVSSLRESHPILLLRVCFSRARLVMSNIFRTLGLSYFAQDNHMMIYQQKQYNGEAYMDSDRVKESKKRRVMIEYVMLEGTTSSIECAHQLGKLCQNRQFLVNLIPYNQTDVKDKLRCPSEDQMKKFQKIVSSYNTLCTIRRTMGADIASACGQLVVAKEKDEPVDIEDVGVANKTTGINVTKAMKKATSTKKKRTVVEVSIDSDTNDEKGDFEHWIMPLMIATTIAASCFVVSSVLFFTHRRGERQSSLHFR